MTNWEEGTMAESVAGSIPSPSSSVLLSGPSSSSFSATSVINSVTAGYAAGICGVVIGHPLDSMKVLLQTNAHRNASSSSPSSSSSSSPARTTSAGPTASKAPSSLGKSMARAVSSAPAPAAKQHAATVTVASGASASSTSMANMSTVSTSALAHNSGNRSIRALYAGITGPLFTVGLIQSANFALYDSFRRILHKREFPSAAKDDYLNKDSLSNVFMASTAAGGIISVITSPLMVIKTKQQIMVWTFQRAMKDTFRRSKSPVTLTNNTSMYVGLKNFYVGFGPHLFCDSLGRGVYFTTYEFLKRLFMQRRTSSNDSAVSTDANVSLSTAGSTAANTIGVTVSERMACAALSGMTCWAVIFPADVIRSKIYAQSLSDERLGVWELTKKIYRDAGSSIKPFFRGFGITILRAGPVAAVVLPVYDLTLEWLSRQ